jgi:Icc-related predicted phosphoesterase
MGAIDLKLRDNGASNAGDGSRVVSCQLGFTTPGLDDKAEARAAPFVGSRRFSSSRSGRCHLRRCSGRKCAGPVYSDATAQQRCSRAVACSVTGAAASAHALWSRDCVLGLGPVMVEEPAVLPVAHCRPREAGIEKKRKVQIMTDLHIGYPGARGFPCFASGADLVMIAGDTCEGLRLAVRLMRDAYPATEIVAVAGNHEFYRTTYCEELDAAREYARELGVHLLENQTVTFGKLRVIGATLWTDYDLFGESLRQPAMRAASETMRDHRRIKWERNPWKRFRPQEARMLHLRSRAYVEAELAKPHDGPTVVLTHHAPVVEAVEPQLRGRLVAAAYASDLGSTIDRYQPDYWISGHTHFPMDLCRGRTRLISNPCGYGDELSSFDPAFIIEVDA